MPLEEAMKYTHLLKKRGTETNSYRRYQTPANPIELQYENTTHSPIEKKQRLKSMQEIINELDLSVRFQSILDDNMFSDSIYIGG